MIIGQDWPDGTPHYHGHVSFKKKKKKVTVRGSAVGSCLVTIETIETSLQTVAKYESNPFLLRKIFVARVVYNLVVYNQA